MYIRRAALDQVGAFNAERFHEGYGEENDFCLRATALGWTHRLACDTFVYHEGQVSFGDRKNVLAERARTLLLEDFPDYAERVARHVQLGHVTPFRFTLTAALFRAVNRPVILMVTHDLGGGVRRHIDALVDRFQHKTRMLLLEGTDRGVRLSIPALPNHPALVLPADRDDDLLTLLRSFNVSRIHIHHLMGMDINIQKLIRDLNKPFDTTIHDYYPICPQRNLLPWEEGIYCGEPGPATCNACIADANDIDRGARDILSWRLEHAWQLIAADRVICPSRDVMDRLARYRLAERAIVAPHEEHDEQFWRIRPRRLTGSALCIAIIGVLANVKGNRMVAALADAARRGRWSINLIGYTDANFPPEALPKITQTGRYDEGELPRLLREARPHVVWFPMVWPETYSYTLTAAIDTGLPIVATDLGAFPERLKRRPLTWLTDYRATPGDMIAVFQQVRETLQAPFVPDKAERPRTTASFYTQRYLVPKTNIRNDKIAPEHVVVVPARDADGSIGRSGYERLLQPLSHPQIAGNQLLVLADPASCTTLDFAAIVTQVEAFSDAAAADKLVRHVRKIDAKLVVDLCAPVPDSQKNVANVLLRAADAIWASSSQIAEQYSGAIQLETRLDERLWQAPDTVARPWADPARIVCIVDRGNDDDFALIEPVLERLQLEYANRVTIDVVGRFGRDTQSAPLRQIRPPALARRSYPAFVHWLRSTSTPWHIGLAPSAAGGSATRLLEYAALGMAIIASDVPAHRDGTAGILGATLVRNTAEAWHEAIGWMIRDQDARTATIGRARDAFLARGSLTSAAAQWRTAWAAITCKTATAAVVLRQPTGILHKVHEQSRRTAGTRRPRH